MPKPFDASGYSPQNRIINELHQVQYAGETEPYIIIPDYAPFFKDRFSIVDSNGMVLQEGQDFIFTHIWSAGVETLGKELFGSIAFINVTGNGYFRLNYQTIGGTYPSGNAYATEGFHELSVLALSTLDWENTPSTWPENIHTHPLLSGFDGMTQIYQKFDEIVQALQYPRNVIRLDDVEDLGDKFVEPTLDSLNQIINAMVKPILQQSVIDEISTKYNYLVPWNTMATNLNYYEFPIARFFTVKCGRFTYDPQITPGDPGGIPLNIEFPTPFVNQCIFAMVKVSISVTNNEHHVVEWNAPVKERIPNFTVVTPDSAFPNDIRTVVYFALGI